MTAATDQASPASSGFARTSPARTVVRSPGSADRDYRRHAKRDRWLIRVLAAVPPMLLLAAWEMGAQYGWFDTRFFSSPHEVYNRGLDLIRDGELQSQTLITIRRVLIGYALGSAAGIGLGLLLSQVRLLRASLEPLLRALYVIPKLAILPILLLLLGIGETPKIVFVALGVFFIMAFSTLTAAALVPTAYHEAATVFRLSWSQRFRWVVVPAALPQIIAALRLASGYAVLLVVAVEFMSARDGVGQLTWHSWQLFVAGEMYVGIVTISAVGVAFSAVVGRLGELLCPWMRRGDRIAQ